MQIPPNYLKPSYAGIRQKLGRLQFPPGESPRVSKMYIYSGNSLSESVTPALPPPRYPCLYQEGVEIIRSKQRNTLGLRVRMVSVPAINNNSSSDDNSDQSPTSRDVMFGDSVQDVVSAVGAPARTFFKSEDKMKIHSPNAHRKAAAQKSDYFYNYFTLGFVSCFVDLAYIQDHGFTFVIHWQS